MNTNPKPTFHLLRVAAAVAVLVPATVIGSYCYFATTADDWVERIEPGGFYVTCDDMPVCEGTLTETSSCVYYSPTIQVTCTKEDGGGTHMIDACQTKSDDGCETRHECD
jgi:hypothetical protein